MQAFQKNSLAELGSAAIQTTESDRVVNVRYRERLAFISLKPPQISTLRIHDWPNLHNLRRKITERDR